MGKFNSETTSGEGGPALPDDTLRGVLQLGWRTGSPWLLDHCDEKAGREEQSSPTFDLQQPVPQWCMAISSNVCLRFSF